MNKATTAKKAGILTMIAATLVIMCMLLTGQNASAASGVAVNATNFPDAGLRNQVSSVVDKNRDKALSTAEINAVTKFNCGTWNQIRNLKGLERFTKLTNLTMRVNMSNVDLSKLTSLKTLDLCNSAYSGNMTIKVKYLDKLNANYMSNVKGITIDGDVRKADISRNPKLENITTKNTVNLSHLDASYSATRNSSGVVIGPNNMNINIIGKRVYTLNLSHCGHKTVKVSGTIADLYCDRGERLETINADGANVQMIFAEYSRNLKKVTAKYGTMGYFDVEAYGCSKLESVDASYSRNLEALHVHAGNTPLKTVTAEYCNKASNYISQVGTIDTINIESPALKNVYLSYSTAKKVYETVKGNGSTVVDQSYNRFTENIYLAGSEKVKTFDARHNHKNIKAYSLPKGATFLK